MTVNFEIKAMLARLLSTEDLIVEHKKVETACFNVQTRVLTLPMWERASNSVYDLLLSHEAAHAIFTDDIDWTQDYKIPPQFVNVVEDARIEKLMKRRYAGLAKTFYNGYKELAEQDFFQIGDDNLETYNLADRANLYFKIGNFTQVPIENGEESDIMSQIANTETFTDVLIAAEALYKYCKKQQDEQTKIDFDSHQTPQSGSGDGDDTELKDQQQGENDQPQEQGSDGVSSDDESQQKQEQPSQNLSEQQGGDEADPEVKTMKSLEKALKDLVNTSGPENVYLEMPQLDLKKIIIPNTEIHNRCQEYWSSHMDRSGCTNEELFGKVDKEFIEFKRSAQKEVNYLVKEFECRKAADSYARATTARTGILDCSKLHTYKYNEDLFKKVTTLANGKNHGLVFVLDWSGSMSNVMPDTVKQLFNLVWFCKKVNIPFEVYAFTQDYPTDCYSQPAYQKKDGMIYVGEWFSFLNMLTSKTNGKTLENQMRNIWRLACAFCNKYYVYYSIPSGLNLSGTPLNESLIALHQILPKFQRENKLQKIQCVILTDGEAAHLKYHREVNRNWETEPFLGTSYIPSTAFLRDRKTGNTYSLNHELREMSDVLLRNLRDRFVDINFIGIRVLQNGDAHHFIRRYCGWYGDEHDKMLSAWKKEKAFSIKKSGYHTYFGLSANALSQDSEFDVDEDASKAQIKSAFMKSLKSKKMNKKILGEFIELVA